MQKIVAFIILLSSFTFSFSQDFSNKGKEFWITYSHHIRMLQPSAVAEAMQLYITSDVSTTGLVEIASVGFSQAFTVTANQITVVNIPRTAALTDEGQYNHGIKVTAQNNVVVYSFIYVNAISGATLCLPTTVLGREYYCLNYDQLSNEPNDSYSYFNVVATEDNTQVEIKPTALTKSGRAANTAFTVTLNKGQAYQVLSKSDLTGSTIKSISSGTGGCKKIAVFCGSGKISIGCNAPATGSSDNLYQQMYPTSAWGKQYVTVPTTNQTSTANFQTNFFRIFRPDPTTVVKLNGATIAAGSFTNGLYHQYSSNLPGFIEADKPIIVAQYFTTAGNGANCGNTGIGDPDMVYLNPLEQTINKVTLNSMQPASNTALTTHFLNVVTKNVPGAINTFRLDGVSQASKFVPLTSNPAYAYARLNVAALGHNLTCDSGFVATAYGFGNAESYAYSAGSNVRDLYQFVTIRNDLASVNFPSTCVNTPFRLSITLPYQPVSMVWDFNANPNLSPNSNITVNPPVGQTVIPADSSYLRDGKTLYVYRLSSLYTFTNAGIYPIKVIANNPTSDGCSGLQEIVYDVQVFAPPTADFTITHNGCLTSPVQFNDASTLNGRPLVRWDWNFGDATTDNLTNPVKTYATPGTYNVNFRVVTDVGCVKDTTKSITISSAPIAKFGVTDTLCINTPLTFTDSSTIASGTIVKWYWDFGNGRKDTLTANTPRVVTYNSTTPVTVSLVVESNTGCKSVAFTKNLSFDNYPFVDFKIDTSVCLPTGIATFTNLSINPSTGDATGLKYNWDFGNFSTSTLANPSTTFSSVGPFNVNLVVHSPKGCRSSNSKTISNIYTKPIATINAISAVCLRDSSTLQDASTLGAGIGVYKYYWDVGNGFKDTTQNIKHLFTTSGNNAVRFFYITDKGCYSDTANATAIVNALPLGGLNIVSPRCETNPTTFSENALAGSGTKATWWYNMGDGNIITKTDNSNFNHIYATWGPYTIKQVVTNSNGCVGDTSTFNITVNPLPKPGFILPEVCLADAAAMFIDTSKIADGSLATANFAWNFGDPTFSIPLNPNTANTKNASHKYSAVGFYPVKLKVTSNNNCIDSVEQNITVNGSIPKANFSVLNSGNLCSNDSVAIQNISTVDFGTITKVVIVWDTLNAPNVREVDDFPAPNKIYKTLYQNFQSPSSKTIYVKFIAYSGGICRDSVKKAITLHQSPKVQFVTIPGICNDTTPRLISQATETGGVPGTFTFSGVGVSATGIFTPQGVSPNTYPIKYVYTSNVYGCRDSATKNITVWPSPQAKWGISSPQCEKNAITFTDTSIANYSNIVNWQWNFGDGNTQVRTNNTAFSYTYAAAGNYQASLRVITDSGCRSIVNQQPIKINYLPKVGFTLPSICLPDGRGTFNDTSKIGDGSEALFSYNWDFGDVNNTTGSTLKNPTHKFSALGPYTIKLIVTSKDACKDSNSLTLTTVFPQPKANFNAVPDTICIGDVVNFTDLSNGITSSPNRWNWDLAQGTTSTLQNPIKQFNDSGTFNISLHVFNAQNCVSDTVTKPVVVMPYPKLEIGPDLFFLEGGILKIVPQFVWGNGLTYLWSPGVLAGLDSINIRTPTASPKVDTRYKLILTGIGGCAVSDSVLVTVLKAPVIPNAFSPNNDGTNDTWRIQYLESYPGASIQVYDRYGKIVFTSIGYRKDWDGKYLGNPLPIGTYYYIVDPKNGRKTLSGSVTILR
ncbi:MAG: PKD domain-containing protein [Chitinophagaceae bacterium]